MIPASGLRRCMFCRFLLTFIYILLYRHPAGNTSQEVIILPKTEVFSGGSAGDNSSIDGYMSKKPCNTMKRGDGKLSKYSPKITQPGYKNSIRSDSIASRNKEKGLASIIC
jgi:hypothetical protein